MEINDLIYRTHLQWQGRRGEQVANVADCGDPPDPIPGSGSDGRHHEVLLHELGRRQSPTGGIARQVRERSFTTSF